METNLEQNRPLTVTEVYKCIQEDLASDSRIQNILVIGEITEFNQHSKSKHIYFSLKDKENNHLRAPVLKCTFFASYNRQLKFSPQVGMEVIAAGSITTYGPQSTYQLNVTSLIEYGEGKLLAQIEKLKRDLIEKGIIDPSKRKKLPLLPKRIGIVTAPNTAAFRDVIKQIKERYPHVEVVVAPALMQGPTSPDSVAKAIEEISKEKWQCDVILVTRGGGSAEDLMSFNSETVAMAFYKCPLPIVSAIGHNTDHPISDEVADLAAATPTDGAKQILPVVQDLARNLEHLTIRLKQLMENKILLYKEKLKRISEKEVLRKPENLFVEFYQRLDELEDKLNNNIREKLHYVEIKFQKLADLSHLFKQALHGKKHQFQVQAEKLEAFSPLAVLGRGYAIVYKDKDIVRSAKKLQAGDEASIRFQDGEIPVTVNSLK